jgi:hypothetical protein
VTFGFVDRGGSSVGLVWARDSALYRYSSSSGFGWTPSRLLPFCCPPRSPSLPRASADAGLGNLGANAQIQFPGGPGGAGCNANEIAVITEAGSPASTVQDLPFYIVVN